MPRAAWFSLTQRNGKADKPRGDVQIAVRWCAANARTQAQAITTRARTHTDTHIHTLKHAGARAHTQTHIHTLKQAGARTQTLTETQTISRWMHPSLPLHGLGGTTLTGRRCGQRRGAGLRQARAVRGWAVQSQRS